MAWTASTHSLAWGGWGVELAQGLTPQSTTISPHLKEIFLKNLNPTKRTLLEVDSFTLVLQKKGFS